MFASVRERLSSGVETRPAFEPRARAAYGLLLVLAAVDLGLTLSTGVRFDRAMSYLQLWAILPLLCGPALRRIGHSSVGGSCEALGLVYTPGFLTLALIYPLAAISGPLRDDWLAFADGLLGFHWPAFNSFITPAMPFIGWSYNTFTFQPFILIPALFLFNQDDNAWRLVIASSAMLLITAAIFPFFPALGAEQHFGAPSTMAGEPFGLAIQQMKGGARLVTHSMIAGLVSFPSDHAGGAVIYAWAAWRLPFARWVFLVVNMLMFVSAIPIGAHYLVDVLAGGLVGVSAIALSLGLMRWRGAPQLRGKAAVGTEKPASDA